MIARVRCTGPGFTLQGWVRMALPWRGSSTSKKKKKKNMIAMLHVWTMAHYRNEIPTIEDFLHMCHLYIS
jgi:hypothetical protein